LTVVHFADDDDPIDIRYDNVFKAVFTRDIPQSQKALSKLVSALIGQDVLVTAITANEPPAGNLKERNIRFDIVCRTEQGKLINVEMSLNPDRYEPVRLEYYGGKLHTGQDIQGIKKSYKDLKESYQIAILAKGRYYDDEAIVHRFEYYDPEHQISLGGRSRIITVELSKAGKALEKAVEEMSVQEQWAVFFRYSTDRSKREKINAILAREEGIAMAGEVLMTISRDEVERARLMSEYKYQVDTQSKVVTAWRDGKKKGRQEGERLGEEKGRQEGERIGRQEGERIGEEKGMREMAKRLKADNVSIDLIAKYTGLPPEEISKLISEEPETGSS
jgi:predicted transposase/invertase (TIGR01784 family)